MSHPMKTIWQWRQLIRKGLTVKQISEKYKVPEGTIRNYTKQERAEIKEQKKKQKALV